MKYFDIIDGYLGKDDRSRNNANLIYSLPACNYITSGKINKDYLFEKVYGSYNGIKAKDLSDEGWVQFQKMDVLGPYCAGFSAKDVATKGLNSNATNNITTRPPKYYKSLLDHCYNFIAIVSQEIPAGACALNDLTAIVASYLWHHENIRGKELDEKEILNAYEAFIYAVNTPFRAGNSPFTNITMNFGWDLHLRNEQVIIGGEIQDIKYKDIPQKYLDMSIKAFIDAMKSGDASGRPFSFPLITINIYDDFDWDNEMFNYLLENMDKWGGCYFENYRKKTFEDKEWQKINKYIEPRDPASQKSFCCRLRASLTDIIKASGGSSFRSNSGIGGVAIANINLNRLGYLYNENGKLTEGFYEKLDFLLEAGQHFNQQKRKFIMKNKDMFPYFFYYNRNLDTFFNIMSIVGGEEMLINMGYEDGLKDEQGRKIAHEVAEFILEKINHMMARDGVPISLEYAPSETGSTKMAKGDLEFVEKLKNGEKTLAFDDEFDYNGNIFVQGNGEDVFLTSGFQPPYSEKNIAMQTQISAEFQSYATGGAVQHFFLGEKLPVEIKKKLIQKTFEKPVIYISLTPTISTCGECQNQFVGEYLECPNCQSKDMQVASRIIGYLRPIASKNLTKENGRLDGDDNYRQDSRRNDWVSRKQTFNNDI